MFYAVRLCGNPKHKMYMKPIEFVCEDIFEIPLVGKTEKELHWQLKENKLYEAGWIKIIEIE